jgi:FKBP-type peptidyl-prolyl cis-trans isomerase FkpA
MIQKKEMMYYLILSGIILISLASCDKTKKYEQQEASEIQAFLASNPSLDFELKTSGLYYLEVEKGSGLLPMTHDTAYIFYSAKFLDGTLLDSNVGTADTLIFPVNEGYLIKGFDEGITYMREGGKALLLTPSKIAYGPDSYYDIPGYTPLLFEIELVRVKAGPGKK